MSFGNSSTPASRSAVATALSSLLPTDLALSLYHIATSPTKTTPLFTPAPSKKPSPTTLEHHFIAIAHDNVLVFAIELLVYTLVNSGERIIFISKADSSGYLPAAAASYTPALSPTTRVSLLRSVAVTAVRVILDAARAANPYAKVTLSLFARSQTQYLFPNSASNPSKHILEDRGLIAWWCQVLDPVFLSHAERGAKAYLLVPGNDRLQTRKLFPAMQSPELPSWVVGHPLVVDPKHDITVREIIPHFPDDPKSRFLDELNGDKSNGKKGVPRNKKWSSIRTVDDFWEMMSMRQECSLGRCVGFIWVVIEGEKKELAVDTTTSTAAAPKPSTDLDTPEQEESSQFSTASDDPTSPLSDTPKSPRKRLPDPTNSILMSPCKKKLKTLDLDNSSLLLQKAPLVSSAIVLDDKRYQRTIDSLLYHTDFGTLDLARAGTRKWVQRSYAVVKSSDVIIRDGWDWGEVVVGSVPRASAKAREPAAERGAVNVLAVRKRVYGEQGKPQDAQQVNVLAAGLVRKKEKKPEEEKGVNVLAAGLVRKKEKEPEEEEKGVNVLAAGLVRKKEKKPEEEEKGVNVLAAGLVRNKEKKPEEPSGVNILGPGLVRKKEKPEEGSTGANMLRPEVARRKDKPDDDGGNPPEPNPVIRREPVVRVLDAGLIRRKKKPEQKESGSDDVTKPVDEVTKPVDEMTKPVVVEEK